MDTRGTSKDELRAAFQQQSQTGRAQARSREALAARRVGMIVSVLLGVAALMPVVLRTSQGAPAGLWIALCGLGLLMSPVGWLLAKFGRTRWMFVALAIGFLLAQTGDMSARDLLP
ncbi:hypothetical protein [Streptomyces boluensis]|uniref:Uncharacterized protein n=1 Tax=Streptomyces boluensis TaxID=1775135 RepID=A0A964XN80_9ACTN|nr:hypothetical protein [Streptomyces boluensis]NBE53512.1 hypothetical protein [Streptomyces boluensis]